MRSGSASQMFAAGALAMLWIGMAAPEDAVAGECRPDSRSTTERGRACRPCSGPNRPRRHREPRRTRSLKWNRDNLALTPKPEPVVASDEPHGFSFLIEFAFDSTEILPESQPYLDLVGNLLTSDEAKGRSIDIVGHADARGPANYNQKLSQARAEAVRSYLSAWYGVPSEQLLVAGRGEEQPLPGTNPDDPENRRVEFLAVRAADAMM